MHILLIQNGYKGRPTALVEEILARQGHTTDVIFPRDGDGFPDVSTVDGCVIFGGGVSVYQEQEHPWLVAEKQFVKQMCGVGKPVPGKPEPGKPVFGICLGAQLLAEIYGGAVTPGAHGVSMGFRPVDIRVVDDEIFGDELIGTSPYNWHGDVYTLASGERLAGGINYPQKAAKFAENVYGVQFHPEITEAILTAWYKEDPNVPENAPGLAQDLISAKLHLPAVHVWLEKFLGRLFK